MDANTTGKECASCPVMWVRGDRYSEKMEPVYRDILPFPESD